MNSITILATADIHAHLHEFKRRFVPCDLCLIGGDIGPARGKYEIPNQVKWFKEEFLPWCELQSQTTFVLVPGNAEYFVDKMLVAKLNASVEYVLPQNVVDFLVDEIYDYRGLLTIYGTPWTQWKNGKRGKGGAFARSDDERERHFADMPFGVDILLTHGCPRLTRDLRERGLKYEYGDKKLRHAIHVKKPRLVLSGHSHNNPHGLIRMYDSDLFCVSLGGHDKAIYNPLKIIYDVNRKVFTYPEIAT